MDGEVQLSVGRRDASHLRPTAGLGQESTMTVTSLQRLPPGLAGQPPISRLAMNNLFGSDS
jgi:hypothetical protein